MELKDRAKALEVRGACPFEALEEYGGLGFCLERLPAVGRKWPSNLKRSDPQMKCSLSPALLKKYTEERG